MTIGGIGKETIFGCKELSTNLLGVHGFDKLCLLKPWGIVDKEIHTSRPERIVTLNTVPFSVVTLIYDFNKNRYLSLLHHARVGYDNISTAYGPLSEVLQITDLLLHASYEDVEDKINIPYININEILTRAALRGISEELHLLPFGIAASNISDCAYISNRKAYASLVLALDSEAFNPNLMLVNSVELKKAEWMDPDLFWNSFYKTNNHPQGDLNKVAFLKERATEFGLVVV